MCLPVATDQKVGGSSPSERAQVRGPLPDSEGAFLLLLGATLSHGHMSATEQSPAHRLSRGPLVTFEQVPVHVLRDGDAGMSENLRDHMQWRALSQH